MLFLSNSYLNFHRLIFPFEVWERFSGKEHTVTSYPKLLFRKSYRVILINPYFFIPISCYPSCEFYLQCTFPFISIVSCS